MYCHNCGQPINEDDLFCPYCGINNPEAEALAASRAAGASMYASDTDPDYYPPDQDDYFEDEYEEIVPEKNPLVPILLAVAAAIVLIAGILILLLKSGGSDDNKLLFTQPEDKATNNEIINWQTLPTLDLERPEDTLATIPDDFVWTMPPVQTSETEQVQPTITPETTAEPEIVMMTPTPTATPTPKPTVAPTVTPTPKPTVAPTATPTPKPTVAPTATPTPKPTAAPTTAPTPEPTTAPIEEPIASESGTPDSGDTSDTAESTGSEDTETTPATTPDTTPESTTPESTAENIQLVINDIVASKFPTVRLYFNLLNENGVELKPGPLASFSLTETVDENTSDVDRLLIDDGHIEILSLIEASAHTLTDTGTQAVKDAHKELVKKVLPEGNVINRMGLVVVPHNLVPDNMPDPIFYTTALDSEILLNEIDAIVPAAEGDKECHIYDAIWAAITKLNDVDYTGALVVYTYGKDSGSTTSKENLKNLVLSSNIAIHIVSLTDDPDDPENPDDAYLKTLANCSRGTFTFLENLGSLSVALDGKYTHEAGNYYIEFASPFADLTDPTLTGQRKVALKYTDPEGNISLTADAVYTPPSPPTPTPTP